MKKQLLLFFIGCYFYPFAQINVTFNINTSQGRKAISPYVYGECNGNYPKATFKRQGGNRMTGYNWENNASNAGNDYNHQSDNYLTWSAGINYPNDTIPAIVHTAYHDSALKINAVSALTLPMAGYVAKDKNNTSVTAGETAPSNRWCAVVNQKGSAFSLNPNKSDNNVYVDEELNFLITKYGSANTSTGIKNYILDNETGLWSSTHPRIHPNSTTCAEMFSKSVALATVIKTMDPAANVFGPECYGFNEYTTLQNASDWSTYSNQYPDYISAYLDKMKQASNTAGKRLLDVLTVHWYPDVYGGGIYFGADTNKTKAMQRMQLPRSLWDSSYIENGWIGQYFSQNLPIIPLLQKRINTYYPGTLLGVTEYDYGASDHISGGIAQADALGALGKTGVSYASHWDAITNYLTSAYALYLNYNGNEKYGSTYVNSTSSNLNASSVYASVEDVSNKQLHIIVLNKNYDSSLVANFNITSNAGYDSIDLYYFNRNNKNIAHQSLPSSVLIGNKFNYTIPKLTACHFVLRSKNNTSAISEIKPSDLVAVYPNPANKSLTIAHPDVALKVSLTNMLGQELLNKKMETYSEFIDVSAIENGVYFLRFEITGQALVKKIIIQHD